MFEILALGVTWLLDNVCPYPYPGSAVVAVKLIEPVAEALEAAHLLQEKNINARVVNMATIKPLDRELLSRCAFETGALLVTEDHNIYGGLGGAVAEAIVKLFPVPMDFVGVADTFGESGEPNELASKYGLDAGSICSAATQLVARKHRKPSSQQLYR